VPSTDVTVEALPGNGSVATPDAQTTKEYDVGITELVTADSEGFSGILKKRYGLEL
jgi:tRNA pseudouridine13 synthase